MATKEVLIIYILLTLVTMRCCFHRVVFISCYERGKWVSYFTTQRKGGYRVKRIDYKIGKVGSNVNRCVCIAAKKGLCLIDSNKIYAANTLSNQSCLDSIKLDILCMALGLFLIWWEMIPTRYRCNYHRSKQATHMYPSYRVNVSLFFSSLFLTHISPPWLLSKYTSPLSFLTSQT